ncbi:MAG: cell division protein FtsL [Treponema sp.]|nr:cell division protein FtsL [Treponema sp.]
MNRRYVMFYFFVLSIPFLLGIVAWQSTRYAELDRNTRRLEAVQENWVESNSRLVAGIAVLSSSARVGQVAARELGLTPIRPENVLQVSIDPASGHGGREQ